jgi:hypothetical protein
VTISRSLGVLDVKHFRRPIVSVKKSRQYFRLSCKYRSSRKEGSVKILHVCECTAHGAHEPIVLLLTGHPKVRQHNPGKLAGGRQEQILWLQI